MRGRGRSSKAGPSILIDTTFLLPALGIEVEPNAIRVIKYFHDVKVHYIEASLLEALWKILKLVSEDELDRVKVGIDAIKETYERADPPAEAYIEAYRLYHQGHRDYIDNLLYSTSRILNIPLLTIDQVFRDFLRRRRYPTENLMTPNDFIKLLNP